MRAGFHEDLQTYSLQSNQHSDYFDAITNHFADIDKITWGRRVFHVC